jgi:hypothetical protein
VRAALEVWPSPQGRHVLLWLAPITAEIVLVAHSVHSGLAVALANFPATHARHAAAASPPRAARVDVPTGHAVQALAAGAGEYFPAKHCVQTLSSRAPVAAENFPAAHDTQAVLLLLPSAGRKVPVGHSAHVLALHATLAPEKVPGPHSRHALSAADRNRPAPHAAQLCARVSENVPHSHAAHCARLAAPEMLWNVLRGQSRHCAAAVAAVSGW